MRKLTRHIITIWVLILLSENCNPPTTQNFESTKNDSASTGDQSSLPLDKSINQVVPDSLVAPNKIDQSGKRTGKWIIFFDKNWTTTNYSSAFYYRKINFHNDRPVGKVKDYYISGSLQWSGQLVTDRPSDVLQGQCFWYRSNGSLATKNNYSAGILTGIEIDYYENGNIYTRKNYLAGELSGAYSEYFENGRTAKTGSYSNGEKSGTWRYYDSDGDCRITRFMEIRTGAICNDGSQSTATGRGACSHHGGVNYWLVNTEEIIIGGTGKYKQDYSY